ncbi:hypothetical protein VF21_01400 [Pseudogymnoascus sp. 05NY08]|nr:hypothetical protein VF21_01400 [Pseudogymnoascus sp. 05NY08]
MGNSTQNGAVPASRGPKNRKRPREVKDEVKDEIMNEDEDSSVLPTHRHRRRRRNSRSRTPSPSPSLGGNDNTPEEEEDTSPVDLPASLDRHACLRCVRFLASEPGFECKFPARSIKCNRCTRLNSKCEPIPAFADAEARRILSLQTKYEQSLPCEVGDLRDRVVAAAEALTVSVRMEAQRRPKTATEISRAILRGQEEIIGLNKEIIGLLRSIKAELTAQGREEKRNGKGKGRN